MSGLDVKEYQTVILGALLHDIGKFMQRAEVELCDISRGMESTLCPMYEGRSSHKHVLWTDHFFENYASFPSGFNKSLVGKLSAIHHKPDSALAEIITIADWLSSGMDRDKEETDEGMGKDAYKRLRLRPVFESVELDIPIDKSTIYRYELTHLEELGVAFPVRQDILKPIEGELLVTEYKRLWDGFEKDVKGINSDDFAAFFSAMLQALKKYTWCIPSSTVDFPDISLYDHLKTTAAIAGCLYLYHAPDLDEKEIKDMETAKFKLLVGDMSGIQNYIFNISHIGAGGSAKRLRARSFTVSVMAEIVTHKFMREFGLTESNILMASGGKFYILLPKLSDTDAKIKAIEQEVAEWLYKELNAEIGLNIETLDIAGKDFKEFDRVFMMINRKLQGKKNNPFSSVIKSEKGWTDRFVLEHAVFGEEEKLCKGCGRLPGEEIEDGKYFCNLCAQDKTVGQALPRSNYIAFYDDEKSGRFKILGCSINLFDDLKDVKGKPYLISSLNRWDIGSKLPVTHRHGTYRIPVLTKDDCKDCDCSDKENIIPGQPMMFECIARKSKGYKVLAYLKADVDRLGEIFSSGLKGAKNSVSRIATMSRMLDLFFSGYIEELIEKKYPYIYIVYSGGDDLLVVGPWDMVIAFAREMEKEFRKFTCNNPNITLSAGITLAKDRLPVFRCVEMADAALDEAKEKPKDGGRNQLWLFGDYVKWEKVDDLLADAENLSKWIADKNVSVSFGRNLLTYGRWKKDFHKTGDTRLLRYLPLLSYDIARNLPLPDKDKSGIRAWAEGIKEPDSLAMEYMGIIANYALTANRGGKDE